MSKISIIIQREYFSRVKKKSFIIMTILGPILFTGLMTARILLAMEEESESFIEVIDDSKLVTGFLKDSKNVKYDYPPVSLEVAQRDLYNTRYTAILWIPENLLSLKKAVLFYRTNPGMSAQERIRSSIEDVLYENQLEAQGIDLTKVDAAHILVNLVTEKQSESGDSEQTNSVLNMFIGLFSGILIYMFVLLYGVQVMRGVMEEKTTRIVEVIISSVKPFQLMMGKIMGIAMVALSQFLIWIALTAILISVVKVTFLKDFSDLDNPVLKQNAVPNMPDQVSNAQAINYTEAAEMIKAIQKINVTGMLLTFLFYFIGGYLLYGALFAAIGSAVDSESDTQQFMLPITLPLIISLFVGISITQNPESSLGFWFSIIPFTSPVVMMARLPFGVPVWEIALSMGLLIVTFLLMTWLAGKIYRTGILMYGKKVSYKELWKWLRYSG